ncbi:hypothetical protein EDF50_1387 [Frigoribacterium sp. PhB24]|nr:hypothetical protein EDF50_1387 [Frigoribacterium sp. PhB24]
MTEGYRQPTESTYDRRMRALQVVGVICLILAGLALIIAITGGSYLFGAAAITLGLIGGFSIYTLAQKEIAQSRAKATPEA